VLATNKLLLHTFLLLFEKGAAAAVKKCFYGHVKFVEQIVVVFNARLIES
jgi:hypothetical protein